MVHATGKAPPMEPVLPNLTRDAGLHAEAVRKPARRRAAVLTQGIAEPPRAEEPQVVERWTAIASIGAWLASPKSGTGAVGNEPDG